MSKYEYTDKREAIEIPEWNEHYLKRRPQNELSLLMADRASSFPESYLVVVYRYNKQEDLFSVIGFYDARTATPSYIDNQYPLDALKAWFTDAEQRIFDEQLLSSSDEWEYDAVFYYAVNGEERRLSLPFDTAFEQINSVDWHPAFITKLLFPESRALQNIEREYHHPTFAARRKHKEEVAAGLDALRQKINETVRGSAGE